MGQTTILVVDDDESVQVLMRVLLTRKGYGVEVASDGERALAELRSSHYDVILLDLMMPCMNGFEVVRELKALSPEVLRRTIIFTAVSDSTLRTFDSDAVFRVIRKPFDVKTLLGTVEECLAQKLPPVEDRRKSGRPAPPRRGSEVETTG